MTEDDFIKLLKSLIFPQGVFDRDGSEKILRYQINSDGTITVAAQDGIKQIAAILDPESGEIKKKILNPDQVDPGRNKEFSAISIAVAGWRETGVFPFDLLTSFRGVQGAKKARNCSKQECGNSCISVDKTCRVKMSDAQKTALVAGVKAVSEKSRQAQARPTGLAELDPKDLTFDPKRFQYKLVHGGDTGASGSLTGVQKWDENLGGVMQIWRDPKDGKDYVVNGHNRASLALKLGAEKVAVRYLNVETPHEARAIGALTNIAEGRGNSLDAAKFFRDSGITRADLEGKGIPMREKIATDGIALSNLASPLFDKVIQGDIPTERAVLIGERVKDHDTQAKLVELIDKEQKKGRKITNDVVRELADTVQSAPSTSSLQTSLFGTEESTTNLALEKAEVMANIRQRLSREKKLFGLVSKSKAAKDLEQAGNQINVEKSKDISDQASQVLGVFDQLKNQSGPVSSAINKAVQRIAGGEDSKKVRDELYKQLVGEIPQALGIRKAKSAV